MADLKRQLRQKMYAILLILIIFILPHAEFSLNDHREHASHLSFINSVKPFKSKNPDKIDQDALNPDRKKVVIEISSDSLTNELSVFIG